MKTVTIRDLRSRPREVQQDLQDGNQALLTSNGRPVAILLPVDSGTLDETLELLQRARAQQAVRSIRRAAKKSGAADLGTGDIERLIRDTRNARRKHRG